MAPRMTPRAKSRPLILIMLEKASWRATLAEKPKWRAGRWQCETQSDPACGGSGGTDGNGADGEDPDVEEEGQGHPLEGRECLGTNDRMAKREQRVSAPDCGSCEPWKAPSG